MNTPDGNTVSTAQLAVSLLCAAARLIPQADMSMKQVKPARPTVKAFFLSLLLPIHPFTPISLFFENSILLPLRPLGEVGAQ
jgi:lactate dehydrogenase-like 2-hydroxyacid dehydrogenase